MKVCPYTHLHINIQYIYTYTLPCHFPDTHIFVYKQIFNSKISCFTNKRCIIIILCHKNQNPELKSGPCLEHQMLP